MVSNRGDDVELTLLIPCLNEALTLPGCMAEAEQALQSLGVTGEIVVADNGSTDGSQEIAAARGARVVPVSLRGYGHALSAGIAAARGRYVIMADGDGSYDFREAGRLPALLQQGCDLVIGNRFAGGIQPGAMPWKNRYLGNPVLSALGRRLFGLTVRDFLVYHTVAPINVLADKEEGFRVVVLIDATPMKPAVMLNNQVA